MTKLFQWDSETLKVRYGIKTILTFGTDIANAKENVLEEYAGAPEDLLNGIKADLETTPNICCEFKDFAKTVK